MRQKVFTNITVRLPIVVLLALLVATVVCGIYYFTGAPTTKATALFGGLVSGLIMTIIQFSFGWADYRATSAVQALGIKNILLHRDEREFYQRLIERASNKIDVMGVTASRFMDDFADEQSGRPEAMVLLGALSRRVEVRILVPEPKY